MGFACQKRLERLFDYVCIILDDAPSDEFMTRRKQRFFQKISAAVRFGCARIADGEQRDFDMLGSGFPVFGGGVCHKEVYQGKELYQGLRLQSFARRMLKQMREISRLLDALDTVHSQSKAAAIATVVRVRGSAYRRAGTKMLIDSDGEQVCMISGGCLEQEVGEIAQQVLQTGEPQLESFDLDEDVVWGLGLGCGGSVDVYIEPFDEGVANTAFLTALKSQEAACLATVIASDTLRVGARMFVDVAGKATGSLGEAGLDEHLQQVATTKIAQLYPRAHTQIRTLPNGATAEIFLDVSSPPPELLVFGAGHDAIPLVNDAHRLGFRATVVDARHAFVTQERFPNAHELVRAHPSSFAEKLEPSKRSHIVIMNHHLQRDTDTLAFALEQDVPYIGVLGPANRYQDMLDALKDEGRLPDNARLERVRNPIGVDIGADTPKEISLSIMAELVALRGNYQAGFLSERAGPIHLREDQERSKIEDRKSKSYY